MLRGLRLMRNYSQHNALLCDIRAAKYDVIVTMDDDLQHQAEEIPRLLAREGFELVYAAPESEQHGVWRAIAFRVTRFGAPFCWETYERISRFSRKITRGIRRLSVSVCFYRRASYPGNNALRCGNSCSRRAIRALQNIVLRKPARHALEMMTGFSTAPLQLPV